jgi:hypothetical protein
LDDCGHSLDITRPHTERNGANSGKARHFVLSLRSNPLVGEHLGSFFCARRKRLGVVGPCR